MAVQGMDKVRGCCVWDRQAQVAGEGTGWGLASRTEERRSRCCVELPVRKGVRVASKKSVERRHEKCVMKD